MSRPLPGDRIYRRATIRPGLITEAEHAEFLAFRVLAETMPHTEGLRKAARRVDLTSAPHWRSESRASAI